MWQAASLLQPANVPDNYTLRQLHNRQSGCWAMSTKHNCILRQGLVTAPQYIHIHPASWLGPHDGEKERESFFFRAYISRHFMFCDLSWTSILEHWVTTFNVRIPYHHHICLLINFILLFNKIFVNNICEPPTDSTCDNSVANHRTSSR